MKRITNYWNVLAVLLAIGLWASPVVAQTYTTLIDPLAVKVTQADGISGSNVVGSYKDSSGNSHGFVHSLSTTAYTTIDDPLGTAEGVNVPLGISGNNIVGYFGDVSGVQHGYLYSLSTSAYTTLDDPLAGNGLGQGTYASGISGNNIVGYYEDSSNVSHGFVYNLSTSAYTTLNDSSGTNGTDANGISGNTIVGLYEDSSYRPHGFVYSLSTSAWTTLDDPLGTKGTEAYGMDGSNIAGLYFDSSGESHGFLYNVSTLTWTTLDDPSANTQFGTNVLGISGGNVVGYFAAVSGNYDYDGFVATVPEPSTVALLAVGGIGLLGYRWRRRKRRA